MGLLTRGGVRRLGQRAASAGRGPARRRGRARAASERRARKSSGAPAPADEGRAALLQIGRSCYGVTLARPGGQHETFPARRESDSESSAAYRERRRNSERFKSGEVYVRGGGKSNVEGVDSSQ